MLRKMFVPLLACVLILACIFFYFRLRSVQEPRFNALTAIPTDASFIIECRQPHALFRRSSESNIIWEDLKEIPSFANLQDKLRQLDSLLIQYTDLAGLLDGEPLLLSAHALDNEFGFLMACSLSGKEKETALFDFLKSQYTLEARSDGITVLSTSDRREICFVSVSHGILLLSPSEKLLRKAISQSLNKTSLLDMPDFKTALAISKSNRFDLRIFLNYKRKEDWARLLLTKALTEQISNVGEFSGWAAMDASIHPKSVLLNGFCSSPDHTAYLDLFGGQEPQNPEAMTQMPFNTASFLYLGFSDFQSFFTKYAKTRNPAENAAIDSLNKKFDTDLETAFSSWAENELVSLITEPPDTTAAIQNQMFVLIRSGNIDRALKMMQQLSAGVSEKMQTKADIVNTGSHCIHFLPIRGLLPLLFGKAFPLQSCYYTTTGNYMLFGNSPDAIRNYLRQTDNEHSLQGERHYAEFSTNLASKCNVYFYTNLARSKDLYQQIVSDEWKNGLRRHSGLLIRFEALGLQFASEQNLFYTTAYLEENPIYKKETATLWETKLDTSFRSKPQLLINHNTGTRDIFVQDNGNHIYLISNTGKILWSRSLPEKIKGEVLQVDAFKNHKLQILFNTRNQIFLIDRNGKDVDGFPLPLPSPATNALALADYEHNLDYRILLAGANHTLMNYTIRGKAVEGWKSIHTADTVCSPILTCSADGKDCLLAADVQGNVYVLDRHGNARTKIEGGLPSPLCTFTLESGKDAAHTRLIACDTLGNITLLALTGKKEHRSFKSFEGKPWFKYIDINNDRSPEFIFLDRHELSVFSSDKSLLFNHVFEDTLQQPPTMILTPDRHGQIGIVAESSNSIYLFNESGTQPEGFPLRGRNIFCAGDANADKSVLLITGEGKNIYAYSIP